MSKSEQIRQELLKRARDGNIFFGDLRGIRRFLEAAFEESLEKKAQQEKTREKANAKS